MAKEQYNEVLRQQEEAYNQIVEEEYLYYEGLPTIHIIPGNSLKVGMFKSMWINIFERNHSFY